MIGTKLSGRYEILDRVGGGGMAVVYKAKDLLLDRIVAVKVLRSQYAIDDDFVQRFRREAQAAASLSHPNIVSIYDVGVEGDTHYIIMEYVEGSTLKEYIKEQAPIPVENAVNIAKEIAEALEHAHQNQIIHRDIKPHNILMGKNNRIKVTDFGIARAVTSSTITHTGSVIGSVHYFSPEQAKGGATGEKSDIYSLGIVLYEMLTGSLPFSGDSPISVALKHLQESYTEPRQLNSSIPQSVENIILRSLAKNPIERYSSATELINNLTTCLHTHRLSENKFIVDIDLEDEEATKVVPAIKGDLFETKVVKPRQREEEEWEEEEEEDRPKRRWVKLLILSSIIFLLGFGAYQGYQLVNTKLTPEEFAVVDVVNLPVDEAVEKLKEQGLRVDTSRSVFSDNIAEGHVVEQDPEADSMVKENIYVRLTVSKGMEKEKMPSVTLLLKEAAVSSLLNYGFKEDNIEFVKEFSDEVQTDFVISQEPEAAEEVVTANTKVTLVLSKGKQSFKMPNLIGKTEDEALALLDKYNLEHEKTETGLSEYPAGQVYRQHPVDPDQLVEAGTPIRIWVSEGYKETSKTKKEEFIVFVKGEEEPVVTIFVTDQNGSNQKVVDEKIEETKGYQVTINVSKEQPALVKVFKDGIEYETREIPYE